MIMKLCVTCSVEQGITKSRYDEELKSMIKQGRDSINELAKEINNGGK